MTFAPDETEQYVNISVVNDNILEGNEMFIATLTSTDSTVINGSNHTATAIIIDSDSKCTDLRKCIYRNILLTSILEMLASLQSLDWWTGLVDWTIELTCRVAFAD